MIGYAYLSDASGRPPTTCRVRIRWAKRLMPSGGGQDHAAAHVTTPWIWPARPPHDVGGALCAAVVFAAGLAVITVRGARESAGD